MDAFQADLLDGAGGQRREHLLVLPPLRAQRLLPVDIGGDAVAVADVNGRRAAETLGRAFQRRHAPGGGVFHIDIEGRLVELNHIHAIGLQRQRLLVQQPGKGHRQLYAVAVVAVGDGVDDGHRAGQGELDLALCVCAQKARLGGVHAALERELGHHLRHHRLVAVAAYAHLHLVLEVDALDLLQKAVHEVLTALLAVADHAQSRIFLGLDPQQRGVELGLRQFGALGLPLRPELLGFGQPGRLGQAAGDCGVEHRGALRS